MQPRGRYRRYRSRRAWRRRPGRGSRRLRDPERKRRSRRSRRIPCGACRPPGRAVRLREDFRRLRPVLHVLHHPVHPRALPQLPARRRARRRGRPGGCRRPRDRAHRPGHGALGRRLRRAVVFGGARGRVGRGVPANLVPHHVHPARRPFRRAAGCRGRARQRMRLLRHPAAARGRGHPARHEPHRLARGGPGAPTAPSCWR